MQHRSACSCTRRSFLKGSGLALTGFGVTSLFPSAFIQHALAGQGAGNRRLLFIFLRGGNDGLNTVIPHGDPDYSAAKRPTLWIPPAQSIDLNGFCGLHPALADLGAVRDAGDLAIVHRVGYPDNSQSHFDGQRIWENGDPSRSQFLEGWLYRYIRENAVAMGAELPVLTVQGLSPTILRGDEKFVNIANPLEFDYAAVGPKALKYAEAWRAHAAALGGLEPYRHVLSQTGVKLVDTLDEYESWNQEDWNPRDPDTGWSLFPVDDASNQKGVSGQAFGFFRRLKVTALALLESAQPASLNGTRIAGTELGGWDTHGSQGAAIGQHADLMSWLAYGMHGLYTVFSGAAIDARNYPPIWNDTTVVTLSEFGRTTEENGSAGTDHACASCMFVAGGAINGGIYNCDAASWPSGVMFGVEGRYLAYETDYRAIFWEILRDHMGAAASTVDTIFPNYSGLGLGGQELGLIAT